MKSLAILTAASVLSLNAIAGAGDHMIHVGAMNLTPDDSSNKVYAKTPVGNVPTGQAASTEDATTLGIGYSYFYTDNIAFGFQVGVPPTHDLKRSGDSVKLGEVEQISPDFKVEYYFGEDTFRPFIGLGVALMKLEGEITDAETRQVLGDSVDIDGGLAPVVTMGVNTSITDNIFLRGSLSYMAFDTTVSFPDAVSIKAGQASDVFADADVNPLVVYLAIGMEF